MDFIIKYLDEYEFNKLAKKSIIHGDFVFTNIIINNFGKIKLIDMRGRLGNQLTLYGDKLYDYAKIYQSLIGYDEILMNKYVSKKYKEDNDFYRCFIGSICCISSISVNACTDSATD